MPVIIRNNDATELCITKGQEGHVVEWQASIGIHGKNVLNTLFIKLDKPAKIIKIDGLPENVVPITRISKNIEYTFSSDLKEYIHVWVFPNFSITDYTSQGKTRPKKPCWLEQLQKSSILLYLFVKKCNCKWNCHCAVIFPLTHHMWSIRIFETGISWNWDIGWDHQAQIWRQTSWSHSRKL